MIEREPVTQAGYEKLKAELVRLEEELVDITHRLAEARAEGDLKENAEYHGLREAQGLKQAKINDIRDKINRAMVLDPKDLPRGEVVFGSTVKVRDLDLDDEETFTLVGRGEEDYDQGKILATSPLAQGLLGRKVGEKVAIDVPAGTMNFEILEIFFEHDKA